MSEQYPLSLNQDDFARLFGETGELPDECKAIIEKYDFSYRILEGEERDQVVLNLVKALDTPLPVSGPKRLPKWEEGWGENLLNFRSSGFDPEALIPGYYRRGPSVMRIDDQLGFPNNPMFEYHFFEVLQAWLANKFLPNVDTAYEFGCGPAHNLLAFGSLYPKKKYVGLDWARASQEIILEINNNFGINVSGQRFDMLKDNEFPKIEKNSVVFTIGAMEQLGNKYDKFFDYLYSQGADTYIHVEPIIEMHEIETLLGYLGRRYFEKRNYLNGYLDHLRSYADTGAIKINECRRILGNVSYFGWCLIVWQKT
ncbi:MAG: hypothetical protein HN403_11895 [Rhodospirillales bacterium]|jgi:hypothetical protein|nr:hypothetical protein [Rhodospirillales bacterium]